MTTLTHSNSRRKTRRRPPLFQCLECGQTFRAARDGCPRCGGDVDLFVGDVQHITEAGRLVIPLNYLLASVQGG